jgi:glucose/arabinose dehydrogenase
MEITMASSTVSVRFNLSLGVCLWVLAACLGINGATLPPGFTETQVVNGLTSPTAMEFSPDGRLFVCQQGGQLRVIKNGALLPTPFVSLAVDASGERGLLGIAFDPNFSTNNFIYLYYTPTSSPKHNQVSRFTANGDVVAAGSEVVILTLDNLSSAQNHNGGAIHFGPDGKLYVAVGDNAEGSNSQTLVNRLGKMLRINSDGTIPTDNPFFNTATGLNRSIWALGLRNPFTFAFQPNTGRMFINDVGQNTWEEINDGIAGSNYGWPTTEGDTNNPNFRAPIFSYLHTSGDTGGCAITGGTFYNPATVQFPSSYVGKYFFADLCNGWIRLLDPANNTATGFATGIANVVDLRVTPDGSLYYLAFGAGGVFRVQFPASQQQPSITTPPSNQTVIQGQTATFQVVASGSAPLSYQWQRNTVNISGANSSTYALSNVTAADSGARFRCVVTNDFGTAISTEATLTVRIPPSITTPPASQNVTEGQSVTFQVTATGDAPLSYQWLRSGSIISGANSPTYTVSSVTLAYDGDSFRCVVTNPYGTATSDAAILTVNSLPRITAEPSNKTVIEGQPATFQVGANGSGPLSYQWQRNTVNIPGANSPSYTVVSATLADNGAKFRCVVSSPFGNATSNEATLTVNAPPNITTPPSNQTVTEGQPATFQVGATGSVPLSYQWQRNTVNISGANSPSYTIASAALSDDGAKFRCVVTNAFGTATSIEATLTVTPPPPDLLTEAGSDLAIAFDSVTMMRDPFPLNTSFNFSADHRTRIMLFATNTELLLGENISSVTAQAEDSFLMVYPLTVEFVGKVPGFDSLTQIVVKLPESVLGNGDLLVNITFHGRVSNKVRIRLQ